MEVAMSSPGGSPIVSVVVVSHNEGVYLRRTVNNLLATLPANGEVIVVDDSSTDGSADSLQHGSRRVKVLRPDVRLGVAGARNFGASYARGDILVFSDAHVEVPPDWVGVLLAPLARSEVGAVGPSLCDMNFPESKGLGGLRFCDAALNSEWRGWQGSDPHPVPILAGFFIAMRRDVFETTEGFDSGMIMFGMEEYEICIHLWTLGYECILVPQVEVSHLYRDEAQTPWKFDSITSIHNILRFGMVHFGPERMQRLVECYTAYDAFPEAVTRLVISDVWERRRRVQSTRWYDDDWYFHNFDMNS
jgi:GT2 family glycosyltransferase